MHATPRHLTSFRSRWQPAPATPAPLRALREGLADWVDAGCLPDADWEGQIAAYQRAHNPVYADWRAAWPERFLPVEAFKHRRVLATGLPPAQTFQSSGTTTTGAPAQHHLDDIAWYDAMALAGFEWFYGDITSYEVLALLPGYLERGQSSLVHMVASFRRASGATDVAGGFFLNDLAGLSDAVARAQQRGKQVLVVGVTYALLDWADHVAVAPLACDAASVTVMETGGMKGTRAEWDRSTLHAHLRERIGTPHIHSEYGMTELLSQAYALEGGRFRTPPWLRVVIGDPGDPRAWKAVGERGRIHLVDLANVHSCSFLATGDVGRLFEDGTFEVLGRFDAAEIRGCNLMVQ